jgi:glycosyltransferase involved in cell wall biosynthesis
MSAGNKNLVCAFERFVLMLAAKKILFVINAPEFFLSHRLPLAIAAKQAGYEVHVATVASPDVEIIKKEGFIYHEITFVRSGQNPIRELRTMLQLFRLFKAERPELVHAVTIKPVLYGGIAARLAGVRSVVAAVSGLGTVFLAASATARARRWLVTRLYRAALRHKNLTVIFQNPDDRDVMLGLGIVNSAQVSMIRGSGVQLADYPYLPEPNGRPVVVMAARLLRDKGVFEFVESARLLRDRGIDVEMRLIGSPDPGNPTSVKQQDLERWALEGCVRLLGYRADIAEQYAAANIVCLPSYREGLPKSLVEAAACGRAVVTTDVPGCRDAIVPDETGMLVPVRDTVALADAIQKLVGNADMRLHMGRSSRRLAEEAFTIERIVEQHMTIYKELLDEA